MKTLPLFVWALLLATGAGASAQTLPSGGLEVHAGLGGGRIARTSDAPATGDGPTYVAPNGEFAPAWYDAWLSLRHSNGLARGMLLSAHVGAGLSDLAGWRRGGAADLAVGGRVGYAWKLGGFELGGTWRSLADERREEGRIMLDARAWVGPFRGLYGLAATGDGLQTVRAPQAGLGWRGETAFVEAAATVADLKARRIGPGITAGLRDRKLLVTGGAWRTIGGAVPSWAAFAAVGIVLDEER